MPSPSSVLHQVGRQLRIHRRWLLAVCLAVLTWSVLTTLRPPDPPSATVWTAVRDLPSGTVLQADHLRATRVPRELAPPAGHGLDDLAGRVLALPVGAGEVATTTQLMGNEQLAGFPGRSALPLRIPDADAVGLLHVGDRVDLVASDPQQAQRGTRIATDVVVLALPGPGSGSGPVGEGRLVVFAIPTEEVVAVAAAASGLFLNLVWNR